TRFDALQKFPDLAHFFLPALGQRPFVVRFFPIRPIRLTVSKKINFHCRSSLLRLLLPGKRSACPTVLHDLPFWTAGARINLPETRAAEEGVSVVAELGAFRQCLQFFCVAAAKDD